MQANQKLSLARPEFTEEEQVQINEAGLDRVYCRYQKANSTFETLLSNQNEDSKRLWLLNQIVKTEYSRGHFKQAFERVNNEIKDLDDKLKQNFEDSPPTDQDTSTHYFYKFHYTKAKLERKMRLLTDAETTCDLLISSVKEEETPKLWWKYGEFCVTYSKEAP